jgi:hypothetical protein
MEKKPEFEVIELNQSGVTFKKKIFKRSRSKKEIEKIEAASPTVTMHFFDYDDFLKLKEIEKEIISVTPGTKSSKGLIYRLANFLEV